jgi:flagellar motor protein MotB
MARSQRGFSARLGAHVSGVVCGAFIIASFIIHGVFMSAQNQDEGTSLALAVVAPLVFFVVALVLGIGIYKNRSHAEVAVPAAVVVVVAASDDASVVVENGVVKFYFASAKSEVAAGGVEALGEIIKAAADGKSVVVSGFHDATGSAEANAELAKERALAVKALLVTSGVPEDKVELSKPEQLAGSGSNAEARRVDVSIR